MSVSAARARLWAQLAATLLASTVASRSALAQPQDPAPPPPVGETPDPPQPRPEEPVVPDAHAADMAAAADATAVAATVTPPADPAGSAAASSDDIDLASLGLDPSAGPTFDDKLNIYGFADFSYWAPMLDPKSVTANLLPKERFFTFGNLNIYLAKNLSPSWRSLAEIRFLYSPNGAPTPDGTFTNTAVDDPANIQRAVSWGGISIQRAYIEHDLHEYATLRAGHWLTPYGIWNLDHGSPTIIGAARPYIIGEQFFPESQTGLDLFGAKRIGEYKLSYHATLSNGRGPFSTVRNLSNDMGYGARVEFEAPWAGSLKLGASVYKGKYVDRDQDTIGVDMTGTPVNVEPVGTRYGELAYAADALYERGGLRVQSEIMARQRSYEAGARPPQGQGFEPDSQSWGVYGLVGYRFDRFWNVMPFAEAEHYRLLETSAALQVGRIIRVYNVGLNFRPTPTVVLKATYADAWFPDAALALGSFKGAMIQVAWVF